jgi:hypothetical protein
MTDHLTFGLRKENKLHAAQIRKTKNIPWDKSSHTWLQIMGMPLTKTTWDSQGSVRTHEIQPRWQASENPWRLDRK